MAKAKQNKASKHPPLSIMRQQLEQQGYQAEFLAANSEEGLPFDSLLIELEEGADDSQYILQTFFMEDMMQADEPELAADEIPDFATLQFMLELPFTWEKLSSEDLLVVYEFLNQASEHIPVGHFRIEDQSIFYTYSLIAETQRVPTTVISATLSLVNFFVPAMDASLQGLIAGRFDLQGALAELERRALQDETELEA